MNPPEPTRRLPIKRNIPPPVQKQSPSDFTTRIAELKKWMEGILGYSLGPQNTEASFRQVIGDGTILCKLMMKIKQDSIPQIHENPTQYIQKKENLIFFINAIEEYGVPPHRQFRIEEISINFNKVLDCLEDLSGLVQLKTISSQRNKPLPALPIKKINNFSNRANVRKSLAITKELICLQKFQSLPPEKRKKIESCIITLQAHVRRKLARRKIQKRVTNQAYRKNVVKEIFVTEKIYLSNLDVLKRIYYFPLKEAIQNGKPILKEKYVQVIFSDSIEVIINYNKQFYSQLEPIVEKWNSSSCIGKKFLEIIQFMKAYTQYVKDYSRAIHVYEAVKTKPKFSQFLYECQQNPETQGKPLDQFLILPVQRIPRYNLLLSDLIKHTEPDHEDYKSLKQSLEKTEEVITYINERKREAENLDKISVIEKKTGIDGLSNNPSRRLLKEDSLTVCMKDGKPKDREIFLFNDKFLIVKTSKLSVGNLKLGKDSLTVLLNLDIKNISLSEFVPKNSPTAFVLETCSSESIHFVAASKQERDEWVELISKTKEDWLKNETRLRDQAINRSKDKAAEVKEHFKNYYAERDRSATLQGFRERYRSNSESESGPRSRSRTGSLHESSEVDNHSVSSHISSSNHSSTSSNSSSSTNYGECSTTSSHSKKLKETKNNVVVFLTKDKSSENVVGSSPTTSSQTQAQTCLFCGTKKDFKYCVKCGCDENGNNKAPQASKPPPKSPTNPQNGSNLLPNQNPMGIPAQSTIQRVNANELTKVLETRKLNEEKKMMPPISEARRSPIQPESKKPPIQLESKKPLNNSLSSDLFCPNCSNRVFKSSKFCIKCGEKL